MRFRYLLMAALLGLATSLLLTAQPVEQETIEDKVYVIPIQDRTIFMVDLGQSSFVKRVVKEAEEEGARAIILEIKTFGGRVDAATDIKDVLFDTEIETIAFINKRAVSAGALLSLSCQTIIMAPGATIGAATPVAIDPEGGVSSTSEKMISYVRKEFKATAEKNNHPVNLAEAMVDPDVELKAVEIDGEIFVLTPDGVEQKRDELGDRKVKKVKGDIPLGFSKGKLLTLTTEEALRFGLASYKASNLEEALKHCNLDGFEVVRASITWSENLARLITHPIITGLLLTAGMLGIIFELRIPGWGVSGTIGLIALALFFGGHCLAGLAGWIEPVLFIIGVALLLLEILAIPGFGIAGISGIVLIVASILLAMIKHPFPSFPGAGLEYQRALIIIAYSLSATLLIIILSFRFLTQTSIWKRFRPSLVLITSEERGMGYRGTSPQWEKFLGREGTTLTKLRPAGRAVIGEEILDVVTEGGFIEPNKRIRVLRVEGNRIVVDEAEGS